MERIISSFVYDGTERSIYPWLRHARENEVFYLPGINIPITNTVGGVYRLTPGCRYYVLNSGRIIEAD